jgi:hypothetical protein
VGHPSANIQDPITTCGAKLVPLTGPAVDKLVAARPYYAKVNIPGGLYAGHANPTPTYGVLATFVTSAKVPDATVYELVKAVFDNFEDFKKLHPAFGATWTPRTWSRTATPPRCTRVPSSTTRKRAGCKLAPPSVRTHAKAPHRGLFRLTPAHPNAAQECLPMFAKKKVDVAEIDVQQLVADNDAGGRRPGPIVARLLLGVTLAWSLFQLWIASPLPFTVGIGVFNDTQSRAIHLAFAVFLAFMAYPAFKRSPRERVPLLDWVFGAWWAPSAPLTSSSSTVSCRPARASPRRWTWWWR